MNNSLFKHMGFGRWLYNMVMIALMIGILTYYIGVWFALFYIIGLCFHEAGHIAAAKGFNLDVSFGGFTPFGAYVDIHSVTEKKEAAYIALAGPSCSFIYCLVLFLIYHLCPYEPLLQVCSFLSFINILNLLPIGLMDGEKVIRGIHAGVILFLLPYVAYVSYYFKNIWFLSLSIIIVLQFIFTYQSVKKPSLFPEEEYSKIQLLIFYCIVILIQSILLYFVFDNLIALLLSLSIM